MNAGTVNAGTGLPAGLAPWAPSLAGLAPDIAVLLGPMLTRLDEFVSRHQAVSSHAGERDGFDGISRRGPAERLLASQWLLAEEIPEEFLRRATGAELLYLAPGFRRDTQQGAVTVLVDTGPSVAGAVRLVHLAAMVVLHRRALAADSELKVAVLTGEPDRGWLTGDLTQILREWLTARTHREARPEHLARWLDRVQRPDQTWVLGGPTVQSVARSLGGTTSHVLSVRERDWTQDGVRGVDVALAGEHVGLAVPTAPAAVRALRGEGFRRRPEPARVDGAGTGYRSPLLAGSPARLILRTDTPHTLVSVGVPAAGAPTPRVRSFRAPGPVLGAGVLGRRLVLVYRTDDAMLQVRVIGQRLANVQEIRFPVADLGLDVTRVAELLDGPPEPLYFYDGDLLWRDGETWWRLSASADPVPLPALVAVGPGPAVDQPVMVWRHGSRLTAVLPPPGAAGRRGGPGLSQPGRSVVSQVPDQARVLLGAGWIAWSDDARVWHLVNGAGTRVRLDAGPAAEVLGVVDLRGMPALLVCAAGGVLLRLVRPDGVSTLTAWSGADERACVHPGEPLIAVVRSGVITIGDLRDRQVRAVVRSQE